MKKRMFLNANTIRGNRFANSLNGVRFARKVYNHIMNSGFCLTPFMKQPEKSLPKGLTG
jgi:hypothetical protein